MSSADEKRKKKALHVPEHIMLIIRAYNDYRLNPSPFTKYILVIKRCGHDGDLQVAGTSEIFFMSKVSSYNEILKMDSLDLMWSKPATPAHSCRVHCKDI